MCEKKKEKKKKDLASERVRGRMSRELMRSEKMSLDFDGWSVLSNLVG